jgi:hypothetical protein
MGSFDSHLRCTIGGSGAAGAAFQLRDYAWAETAIIKEGLGRIGKTVSVTGRGWVETASASTFAAAVIAASVGLQVSGQDVVIYGLGGNKEAELLAAWCQDGGPHCSFKILEQGGGSALVKEFEFSIEGKVGGEDGSNPDANPGTDSYKEEITRNPSGLYQVTRSGEVYGPGVSAWLLANRLPAFESAYPDGSWTRTIKWDKNATDTKTAYTFSASQFSGSRPSAAMRGGAIAQTMMRTDAQRMEKSLSYDLTCAVGTDLQGVVDACRGQAAGLGTISSESIETQSMPEPHVRCRFTVLASGSGDDLLEFQQTIRIRQGGETYKAFGIPGRNPIVYTEEKKAWGYEMSGSATGLNRFPKPPDPDTILFESPPEISYDQVNEREKRTSWRYVRIEPNQWTIGAVELAALGRPSGAGVTFF